MLSLYIRVRNWLAHDDGQGMTEYAMIIGLIALALVVVIGLFGTNLHNLFTEIVNQIGGIHTPTT